MPSIFCFHLYYCFDGQCYNPHPWNGLISLLALATVACLFPGLSNTSKQADFLSDYVIPSTKFFTCSAVPRVT